MLLEDAEKQNPFRPQIFFIRGLLYNQNPDLADGDWAVLATRAYATALKRDPLAFWARETYAGLAVAAGSLSQAKCWRLVLIIAMPATPLWYYSLLARVRRETRNGARGGAGEKNQRIGG